MEQAEKYIYVTYSKQPVLFILSTLRLQLDQLWENRFPHIAKDGETMVREELRAKRGSPGQRTERPTAFGY